VAGEEFDVLDALFADVDDYVSDPTLRESTGGISGEELRARTRDAYTRLFDAREGRPERTHATAPDADLACRKKRRPGMIKIGTAFIP
jgi:PleD family two-component response regulator